MDKREKKIYRVTLTGSAVNVLLTVVKFAAGVLGHSSAMIADAVHSLSDLISDAIVLIFVKIAGKPEDSDHSYGHGKYETFATLLIGFILGIVGLGILADGVQKTVMFFEGKPLEAPNWWALGAAVLSILLKEWLYRYTVNAGKRIDSQVLVANAWHHRSDAYTSVAALAGIGGAMLLGPRWSVLDPLAAAFVSVYIIIEAVKLCKPAIDELMEKSLSIGEQALIESIITAQDGVDSFHRLRTRRIGSAVAISVHVKMPGDITLWEAHARATAIENALRDTFGHRCYISIHMEPTKPGLPDLTT